MLGRKAFEIAHLGLGYVPENRDIFPKLTVHQNLMLGEKAGGRRKGQAPRWSFEDMYAMFPRLKRAPAHRGRRAVGRRAADADAVPHLMGDPDLIMIDEPTEGLAPKIVELVAEYLKELKQRGVSVLLVEQKLTIALEISERCYVMGHGQHRVRRLAGRPARQRLHPQGVAGGLTARPTGRRCS
jgi:branched-chain amino acid transport system ATP-binding protein